MKKKKIIVLMLLGIFLLFGVFRLRIQSVSQYQKEQEELAESLDIQTAVPDAEISSDKNAAVRDNGKMSEKEDKADKETPAPAKENRKEDKTPERKNNSSKNNANNGREKVNKEKKPAKDKDASPQKTPKPANDKHTPKAAKKEKITCLLEITCHSLVGERDNLEPSLAKHIPENGEILSRVSVKVDKEITAYAFLLEVCKASGIPVDAEYTPVYGSYYVKGINHIYEKSVGKKSGWIFKINGVSPNVGASGYKMSEGDVCTWCFTCDGKSS